MNPLTPEEIAEIARRAAAGEKPLLTWVDVSTKGAWETWAAPHDAPFVSGQDDWWTCEDLVFRSKEAAKLAAEEMVRRATAPLHQAETNLGERIKFLRSRLRWIAENCGAGDVEWDGAPYAALEALKKDDDLARMLTEPPHADG